MKRCSIEFFSRAERRSSRKICSAKDTAEFLADMSDLPQEVVVALVLDAKNFVISKVLVSVGTATGSLVHPREVFREAIMVNGTSIVLAHNHPSGNCNPSPEDESVTRRIAEAGRILGIRLLDHIIISGEDLVSLASTRPGLFGVMDGSSVD